MAKPTFSYLCFLVLVLSVTMAQIDAVQRCQVVLNPNDCELSTCREQCLKAYNGNGVCTPIGFTSFRCMCFYNC
ncbi:hypothetical protein RJ639_004122 [Escallonia herrerae]|uniref:Defensin n=1 Tax=Escallonia herrerae TaxID=1293975 RepID=A0AA88W9E1_9ASTE|nr:hypothetical protein RJ639_004122 [Escallonia herrerae]